MTKRRRGCLTCVVALLSLFFLWVYVESEYGFIGPSQYDVLYYTYRDDPDLFKRHVQALTKDQLEKIVQWLWHYVRNPTRLVSSWPAGDGYFKRLPLLVGARRLKEASAPLRQLLEIWQRNHELVPSSPTRSAVLWAVYRIEGDESAAILASWFQSFAKSGDITAANCSVTLLQRLSLSYSRKLPWDPSDMEEYVDDLVKQIRTSTRRERWTEAMVDMGYAVEDPKPEVRLYEMLRFVEWVWNNYSSDPMHPYDPINGKWDVSGCLTATMENLITELELAHSDFTVEMVDYPEVYGPRVVPINPEPWKARVDAFLRRTRDGSDRVIDPRSSNEAGADQVAE